MKKSLLFLLFPVFSFSQDLSVDSISVVTYFEQDDPVYRTISTIVCDGSTKNNLIKKDENMFFVTDVFDCNNKTFLEGYYLGEKNYLEYLPKNTFRIIGSSDEKTYTLSEIRSSLNSINENEKKRFDYSSNLYSKAMLLSLRDEAFEKINSYQKYPIAIIKSRPTEDYSMTGAEFEIMNFSSKTIKYITFNFYGKNAVKDKVLYRAGAYNVSRKGIGPIKRYGRGAWSFDSVWLTDVVQTLELTSANIIYMDGSSRLVKITDLMWIGEDPINLYEELSDQLSKVEKD